MPKLPIDDLLQLSLAERIHLAQDLWDSIASDPDGIALTEEQTREIRRRLESHRAEASSAMPWDDLRRELYA